VAIYKSAAQLEVESQFPKLKRRPYIITSSKTPIYNCVAWAVDDIQQWWEYGAITSLGIPTYWPPGYPAGDTVADVSNVLQGVFHYTLTTDRRARLGTERVAIYGYPDRNFAHIARQLESGRWSSKLGELYDLEHALNDLEGRVYGRVMTILERQKP
jgi:hypothetical protein